MDYHLITLEGFLDISRLNEFKEAFRRTPDGVPVLVDVSAATGVDSVFVAELFIFKRRHRARVNVLVAPGSMVARVFAIANVGERMNVYTNRDVALDFRTKLGSGS